MPRAARVPLALVAAASCLLPTPSAFGAKAPPTCPQLVDRRGDQSPTTDQAADLRSVALRSTARSITILVGYQGEPEAGTPLSGHIYSVVLDTGESAVQAWAYIAPSGNDFRLYRTTGASASGGSASASTPIGSLAGRVDSAAHMVHMTIPYALAPEVLRVGGNVIVTSAVSTALITPDLPVTGAAFASNGSDDSDAPARYRVGSRGC